MKKSLAIIAAFVAAVSFASAKEVSFGFKGALGPNWGSSLAATSSLSSSSSMSTAVLLGFGGFANISLSNVVSIQPELWIMGNNFSISSSSSSSSISYSTSCNYASMDIPVLLAFKVKQVNIVVGPYLSIPLGDLSMSMGGFSGSSSIANGTIPGMLFGAEYAKKFSKFDLIVGGRYLFDFWSICDEEESSSGSTTTESLFTRRGLLLTVGLSFKKN